MSTFYESLPYEVEYGGKTYKLTPAYDNVLNMYASIEGTTDEEKLSIMLYYLFDGETPQEVGLLQAATDALFTSNRKKTGDDDKRSFDFIQDADLIYAAFRQAYNIDLVEEQGRLHWWKFQALLSGLPEDTKFVQVIQIRTRELPKPTKYNAEERAQIMKLKQQFALEISAEERERGLQSGLQKMAMCLEAMARRNEQKEEN